MALKGLIYNTSKANDREQWRRSLAGAGLTLVDGSFEEGATVNSKTDAVWYISGGRCYTWDGALPKVIPAGSTPASTGGISAGGFVDRSNYLTGLPVTTSELATGKFVVGTTVKVVGRGSATFTVKAGGTANGFDVLDAGGGNTASLDDAPVYDIEWFGAVGDGVTDDGPAYNAAILRAGGAEVYSKYTPRGYKIITPIVAKSYMYLTGQNNYWGSRGTRLIGSDGGDIITLTAEASGVRLHGILFDGYGSTGVKSNDYYCATWEIHNCSFTTALRRGLNGVFLGLDLFRSYFGVESSLGTHPSFQPVRIYWSNTHMFAMSNLIQIRQTRIERSKDMEGALVCLGGYMLKIDDAIIQNCSGAESPIVIGGYTQVDIRAYFEANTGNSYLINISAGDGFGEDRVLGGINIEGCLMDVKTSTNIRAMVKVANIKGCSFNRNYVIADTPYNITESRDGRFDVGLLEARDNLLSGPYAGTIRSLSGGVVVSAPKERGTRGELGSITYGCPIGTVDPEAFNIQYNGSNNYVGVVTQYRNAPSGTTQQGKPIFNIQGFNGDTFTCGITGRTGVEGLMFYADGASQWAVTSLNMRPNSDGAKDLGTASFRIKQVYATVGAINTSDGREKTKPFEISDDVLDAWGDVELIAFKWLEAIAKKGGDLARTHFGVIAQQVRDAFLARGLDGCDYGLLCYDEWEDEYEEVLDDDGVNTGERLLVKSAGNRWGIRPDQCLFLEAAYQRRRCDRIEQRLCAAGL